MFEDLDDSLIRDRIVVGIRDEPTRRRLLQQKKLTLSDAIDTCKASEATSRRLRKMGGDAEVDALRQSLTLPHTRQPNDEPHRNRVKRAAGSQATAVGVSTAIASPEVRKKRV